MKFNKMSFKDWVLTICALMIIVSVVLKIFNVKGIDTMLYVSGALFFFTLAFKRVKKTETKQSIA